MVDFVFTARRITRGNFGNAPGPVRFLQVPPDAETPLPRHEIRKLDWINTVQDRASGRMNMHTRQPMGDIVIYVHGYNHSPTTMLARLRDLRIGLAAEGFTGVVLGFDWPSADNALNYLDDRWDGRQTAYALMREGIASFVRLQRPDCEINLHVLAHSMGSFVVREAFDYADDRRPVAAVNWTVSQVLLFGADVSASSLADGAPKSSSLYRHCNRLTNYFNHHDSVLSLSNIKRIGVSPRAGRVGLPVDSPRKAVNVDCSARFLAVADDFKGDHFAGHRWYFTDPTFLRDAYETITGDTDRHGITTRDAVGAALAMKAAPVSQG